MYILTNDARETGLSLPLLISNWTYFWKAGRHKKFYRKLQSHEKMSPYQRRMAELDHQEYCRRRTQTKWDELATRARKDEKNDKKQKLPPSSYSRAREQSYNSRHKTNRSSDEMGYTRPVFADDPPHADWGGYPHAQSTPSHDTPSFSGFDGGSSGGGGASGSWGDSSSDSGDSGGDGGGDGGGGGD